jgi:hypothetical protein
VVSGASPFFPCLYLDSPQSTVNLPGMRKVALVVLVSLALSGCVATSQAGTATEVDASCPEVPELSKAPADPNDSAWINDTSIAVVGYGNSIVGMTEADAEKCVTRAGLEWRVVARDGEFLPTSGEYSPLRINAIVNSDVVSEFNVG